MELLRNRVLQSEGSTSRPLLGGRMDWLEEAGPWTLTWSLAESLHCRTMEACVSPWPEVVRVWGTTGPLWTWPSLRLPSLWGIHIHTDLHIQKCGGDSPEFFRVCCISDLSPAPCTPRWEARWRPLCLSLFWPCLSLNSQSLPHSRLCFFQWSCMNVSVGLWRKLSAEKLMLLNSSVGEDFWESLGLQRDPTSPS